MPQVLVTWIAKALMLAIPGMGLATATAIAQFGVGILISAVRGALTKEQQVDVKRELSAITERPAYRYVYGWDKAVGTPAPRRVYRDKIVACYILNSRPSFLPAATTKVYLDEREITWSGDPFNLSGPGATSTGDPVGGLARFWITRGDQTIIPPAIIAALSDANHPDYGFKSTDVWRGLTVMWAIFDAGDDEDFQENWPSNSPHVSVYGQWSYVWNPGSPSQSPTDSSTWLWSQNAALCTLDALRRNPIAPYPDDMLMPEQFAEGAISCNEPIPLAAGGTEPRYRVGGTLTWMANREVEDQIEPLLLAAAASLVRVGGKLGYKAGVWHPPTRTITDIIGEELEFSPAMSTEDTPTEIKVTYVSAARGYEQAELKTVTIPGATERNGGVERLRSVALTMVNSATQAMRIRNILVNEAQRQRLITCTYPPEAFALTPGENHNLTLPPGQLADMMNGIYEAQQTSPLPVEGEDGKGVSLRCPVQLMETGAWIYAWSTADEEEVYVPAQSSTGFVPFRPATPTDIGYEVGPQFDLNTGGAAILRARWWIVPAPNTPASTLYEWQYRVHPNGIWQRGGTLTPQTPDGLGRIYGFVEIEVDKEYAVRVRARRSGVAMLPSAWLELNGISLEFSITDISMTAGASAGTLNVQGTQAGQLFATRVRLYRNGAPVGVLGTADPGQPFSITWSGLPSGPAGFSVAPITTTGQAGTVSASFPRTIV